MFGREIKLFTLLGFKVKLDASWFFLALLIVWSLAEGVFTRETYGNFDPAVRWGMGAAGAMGFFLSIVLHELSHSVVARKYGMPMRGITLFIFGGVAEMDDEPPTAKSEFLMAIAGPIASLVIGGAFYLLAQPFGGPDSPSPAYGVLSYLAAINVILAVFNMVPAFPLDGGRVLRSALWAFNHDLRKATRISSAIGGAFGFVLITLGVLAILGGGFIAGLWWCMIGLFIRGASNMSYKQLLLRKALSGERVERFMKEDPVTVSPDTSVEDLVENYIYEHHFKLFPVVEDGKLRGCVTTRQVKELSREEWSKKTVGDLSVSCDDRNTVSPGRDAMDALTLMNKTGSSRLLVKQGDSLRGVIALKDLMRFLSLKLDLEEDESLPGGALPGKPSG